MPVITIEEAKRHLRITGSENDARLGQNLAAAEEHVARYIGAPLTVDGETPAGIREAILQQTAFLFDGTPVDLAGLLMPYRSEWF